jgi:signal transduction histidine kinase
MSNGYGLILQPRQKNQPVSNVNLLITSDDSLEIPPIIKILEEAGVSFKYEVATVKECGIYLAAKVYDALIYSYSLPPHCSTSESPLTKLEWWQKIASTIPLILITDVLGDEVAVECIQAGVSGYILKSKLYKLPDILESCLLKSFQEKQQLQKLKQIQQQQEYIKQLEAEKNNWQQTEIKKQELLSHLHHELRNPITAILGFAGMLKEEIYGSLNQRQMQYSCAIATAGEHLLELVNDYLDLAKIDAQQETLYLEKLPVEDICRAALAMVQEKARKKGIELIFYLEPKIDFCWADKLRLKQILVNLLSNAVKFTEIGAVTLQVKRQKQMLTFAVIDTGIGISPQDQQKLFQPFQQIQTRLHRREQGTGLGLALSRKLARLHGGDISLDSKFGEGSCFTLHLPLYNPKNRRKEIS